MTSRRKAVQVLLIFTTTLCAVPSASVQAQRERGRGGPWGRMREAIRKTPEKQILDFLHHHESIKKEVDLAPDTFDSLSKIRGDAFRHMFTAIKDLSPDERFDKIVEINQQYGKDAIELIKSSGGEAKLNRLFELYSQTFEAEAIDNGLVAQRVGLTEEELHAFRDLLDEERNKQDLGKQFEKIMRIPDINFDEKRERMESLSKRMRKELNETLLESLSETQRAAYTKLQGEPFADLPHIGPGGPRGPGGPGRGSRSGRAERGNSDDSNSRREQREPPPPPCRCW